MAQVRTILIADDDEDLRQALAEQLALHEEFEVLQAENGAKAISLTRSAQPDLVIMDVGMPDFDGREAVKIIRKNGFKNPILMLTAQDSDADTVLGFDSGANDYVTKPFRFAVLLARIRAHLRQFEASDDATFRIGQYTFQPSSKHLVNDKGNKLRSIAATTWRLGIFFHEDDLLLNALTPERCRGYYDALRTRPRPKTNRPLAVDSHRNILAEARSFLGWCVGKRWLARNPLEDVVGVGKRRHGKAQLRIDEARRWQAKALQFADQGEEGAVAAMMSLLMGMRASEIVSRVVRDLDDEGRLLWIRFALRAALEGLATRVGAADLQSEGARGDRARDARPPRHARGGAGRHHPRRGPGAWPRVGDHVARELHLARGDHRRGPAAGTHRPRRRSCALSPEHPSEQPGPRPQKR